MREITREEAIMELSQIIKEGDTIYSILRSVAKSGMSKVISFYVFKDPHTPIKLDYYIWVLGIGEWDSRHNAIRIRGYGFDAGYHVVYELSYLLFGDGYRLNHRWL